MSTHSHWLHLGDLFGIAHLFDHAGDGLPMHSHHLRDREHDVLVIRGAVLVYGPDGAWSVRLTTGQLCQFDSSKPHEIAALEAGTVILNVFKHGLPPGYEKLPESEHNGALDMELTHRVKDGSIARIAGRAT